MLKIPLNIPKIRKFYLLSTVSFTALSSLLLFLFSIGLVSARESLEKRKNAVVRAVEKAGPAVVNISTEEIVRRPANSFYGDQDDFFKNFYPGFREKKKQNLGSGVLIDSQGYILTNHHVITQASRIKVTLIDKREFEAELIGADPKLDIAIIKIDGKEKLPFIEMGRSDDLLIGESIIAVGNPFGLSHTVTTGVVSAVGRDVMTRGNKVFTDLIQLDTPINPGNSGGPLLNIEGSLIGINTAIYHKTEGIGFAIPIDRAKRIVRDLIQYGTVYHVWLGLFVQDMDPKIAAYFGMKQDEGVLVSKVFKEGPAEEAGIQQGDVIIEIGGKQATSKHGYFEILSMSAPNETMSLTVTRDKRVFKRNVVAKKIQKERTREIILDWLGFEVAPITKKTFLRFHLQTNSGVVVTHVTPGSAVAGARILPGDVVKQINREKIANMSDFEKSVAESFTKYSALLLIQRESYGYYVTLEP